jgi:hypothetical protein
LKGGLKLIIIVRLANKSVSLEVEYQDNLTKVGIHLVSLYEFQDTSFLILMCVDEFSAKFKAKGLSFGLCVFPT